METAFNALTKSDNPIIALLASLVVIEAGVIVYQWRYAQNNTVPKWIWDSLSDKISKILEIQEKMLVIIDERLKK